MLLAVFAVLILEYGIIYALFYIDCDITCTCKADWFSFECISCEYFSAVQLQQLQCLYQSFSSVSQTLTLRSKIAYFPL